MGRSSGRATGVATARAVVSRATRAKDRAGLSATEPLRERRGEGGAGERDSSGGPAHRVYSFVAPGAEARGGRRGRGARAGRRDPSARGATPPRAPSEDPRGARVPTRAGIHPSVRKCETSSLSPRATHLRATFMPVGAARAVTLPPSLARGAVTRETAAELMRAAMFASRRRRASARWRVRVPVTADAAVTPRHPRQRPASLLEKNQDFDSGEIAPIRQIRASDWSSAS